jgi:hypothetical protein
MRNEDTLGRRLFRHLFMLLTYDGGPVYFEDDKLPFLANSFDGIFETMTEEIFVEIKADMLDEWARYLESVKAHREKLQRKDLDNPWTRMQLKESEAEIIDVERFIAWTKEVFTLAAVHSVLREEQKRQKKEEVKMNAVKRARLQAVAKETEGFSKEEKENYLYLLDLREEFDRLAERLCERLYRHRGYNEEEKVYCKALLCGREYRPKEGV